MTPREQDIAKFLAAASWADATRHPLAGDASNRRYERLTLPTGNTAVLMDAPPTNGEDVRPFLRIAQHLTAHGFAAPRIFAQDPDAGLLLTEDLGDALFARLTASDPNCEGELYKAAVDVLLSVQSQPAPTGLDAMTVPVLADMVRPLFEWYLHGAGLPWESVGKEFHDSFLSVLQENITPPSVLVLRDFHAENLIWLPERSALQRVGLLDFQDAVLGDPAYDLVSLLQDARRDVPLATETSVKDHFLKNHSGDPEKFERSYCLLGAQRNLRIVGVFARLCMHFGKPHYVDMIPRVYDLAMRNLTHPVLKMPAKILAAHVPAPTPEILEKIKTKCASSQTP